MAIYERGTGAYVAERVQPVPGSEEAERYEELAADPDSGWRRVDDGPEEGKQAPPGGGGEGDSGGGPEDTGPPARSPSKADWVAYAVSQGMTEAEADKEHTRDQLAARYLDGGGS
jgi:hypothetical protein